MRKTTPEQIAQKREEIINACEQLYQGKDPDPGTGICL